MKKFAVFDIDGTLIRWQLYHAVVDRLSKDGVLHLDAQKNIHEARMKWKRRESTHEFKEYERTLISEYEKAVTTIDPTVFDQAVAKIIEEYQDQTYTYTRDLLKKLKAENYTILAISGSHSELIARIAKHYEFDDFTATEYERTDSGFSGEVFVASFDKKAVLNKLVEKHGLTFEGSYAVGDSGSDAAMLEMVENPIAFNPEEALFKLAEKNGWKVVIERKNMIYELEQQNGTYVLVQAGE